MKVLVHMVAIKLMYQNLIWNEDDNVHGKVVKHLNEFHPLSDHQWGFRPGKSTTHALLSATNEWFKIPSTRYCRPPPCRRSQRWRHL